MWQIHSTPIVQKDFFYKTYCHLLFSISIDNQYVFSSIISEMTIILTKNVVEKITNKIRTFEPEIG